jgi:hypothetical protein
MPILVFSTFLQSALQLDHSVHVPQTVEVHVAHVCRQCTRAHVVTSRSTLLFSEHMLDKLSHSGFESTQSVLSDSSSMAFNSSQLGSSMTARRFLSWEEPHFPHVALQFTAICALYFAVLHRFFVKDLQNLGFVSLQSPELSGFFSTTVPVSEPASPQ